MNPFGLLAFAYPAACSQEKGVSSAMSANSQIFGLPGLFGALVPPAAAGAGGCLVPPF